MKAFPSIRPGNTHRRWVWAGSLVVFFSVAVLLAAAFGSRSYSGPLASPLLTLVLIALGVAIFLHVRFMILARREQQETAGVLDATGREFQSIFDSALDAILILDDRATCLEANPAALRLLGAQRNDLVGQSIQRFHSPLDDFEGVWKRFLNYEDQQGELELVRCDGVRISAEYTAKTNYLPGRHVVVMRDVTLRKQMETALRESDDRFQQMANNIQEIYWMLDAKSRNILYINPAYETITGRSVQTLRENPTAYEDVLHPEDRIRILTRLEEATRTGEFDEEFRIVRPDHSIRWVAVRGVSVRDSVGVIHRLVGIAQDISARKSAEEQMATNLNWAQSAWAEADAFRKTTLALTQNLKMDCVLDSLLESLLNLVPCESARILLVEYDAQLFLARELQHPTTKRREPRFPNTVNAKANRFMMQVLTTKTSLLVPDTAAEPEWSSFKGSSHIRSWLCVPLVASQQVLGLLSLGDTRSRFLTTEHLRLAKSLAIPAAVAIQNARLYERAEIYGFELEQRLADLENVQQALQQAEASRMLSEDKFAKIFRCSPIAFSIAAVADGRFVEVNEAFERRYGYSSEELIGRTVHEIGIWEHPEQRLQMLDEIRKQGYVRNCVARFRARSGEMLDTIYSADIIEIDGQPCLLAVSEEASEDAGSQNRLYRRAATSR